MISLYNVISEELNKFHKKQTDVKKVFPILKKHLTGKVIDIPEFDRKITVINVRLGGTNPDFPLIFIRVKFDQPPFAFNADIYDYYIVESFNKYFSIPIDRIEVQYEHEGKLF